MIPANVFEVLPGKHTIIVGLGHNWGGFFVSYSNKYTITFDTEAGKKYIVDYRSEDESYFITEKESGKVIYDQAVPYPHITGQMVKMTPTKSPDIVSDSVSGERVSAIEYYGEAEEEVNTKSYDKNLWAKALVEAEGDEQKRVASYIELRANQLYSENVSSISKSNLNEQPVPGTDISGTYVSDIRGGADYLFNDRKLLITIKQSDNEIIGTDVSQRTMVKGTRKGDTIKFKFGNSITGVWKINPDGTKLEGSWDQLGYSTAHGTWNLTKIE